MGKQSKPTKLISKPTTQKKITKKQLKFCKEYIETDNATEAAARVYKVKNRHTARVMWSENLAKPVIKAYLDAFGDEAGETIVDIMRKSKRDNIKLDSAKYVYDQVHWKATQKTENKTEVSWSLSINQILDDIINGSS